MCPPFAMSPFVFSFEILTVLGQQRKITILHLLYFYSFLSSIEIKWEQDVEDDDYDDND